MISDSQQNRENVERNLLHITEEVEFNCTDFNCMLNKFKKSIDPSVLGANKDSFTLVFHFFSLLIKQNFELNVNINRDDFYYLKKFVKEKPFTVLECDKNIGLAFIFIANIHLR